ncbi:hypothetical protein BGX24_009869 [Mortierella sp. AD032]|nr:hypothetical protein BGX24_009869 [Mortierella sp. AD032]
MTQDTLDAISHIKQGLATEVYPFVRNIAGDGVVQTLDAHGARRSRNWLKTSGLVTQGDLSDLEGCAGCGAMRKARRGAKVSVSEDTRNWCVLKSVDAAVGALEKTGWDERELIKYQQWSEYFHTECAKKLSVWADKFSTICEWVSRNNDDYMRKDEWIGRTQPWRVLRERMEDFKDGAEGYVPEATQSQGTAADRIISAEVDLDAVSQKLEEVSDVRIDLVAIEVDYRRH